MERCVNAIIANAGVDDSQYEIKAMLDDSRIGCPRMVAMLTDMAKYDWVMFLAIQNVD